MSAKLTVGDDVQWMVTKQTRNGYSFGTSYGKILSMDAAESGQAMVKKRNGTRLTISIRRLVPRNQPSPVNHVFGAMTEGVK